MDDDEYNVTSKGAKRPKCEGKRVGAGIFVGFIGAILSLFVFGVEEKIVNLLIVTIFVAIGFFGSSKIFKK